MTTANVSHLLLFGATGDLAQRMLLPSLYGLHADGLLPDDCTIIGTARTRARRRRSYRAIAREALERACPARLLRRRDGRAFPRAPVLRRRSTRPSREGLRARWPRRSTRHDGLAIFLSTAPSLFEPTIDGLAARGPDRRRRVRHRRSRSRSAPTSPRAARSTTRSPPPSPRSGPSASTIISARRRSRTCSRCASPIRCSSRCGMRPTSTMSRSPSPRPSGSRAAATITTAPARCATWSRTTCCSCSRWWRWSRRPTSTRPRCATRRSRCCARCARSADDVASTRHRPVWRGRGRRRAGPGLCRGARPRSRHRDLRRAQGACRQLALGGRALLPAHRQAAARAQDRDRHPVQVACRIRSSPSAARRRSPTSWSSRIQPEENIRLLVMAKTPGLDRDGIRAARGAARRRPRQRLCRHAAAHRL